MRPLDTGTILLGITTVGAIALAMRSKDDETRMILYSLATGTGVGAVSLYLAEREAEYERERHRMSTQIPAALPPPPPTQPSTPPSTTTPFPSPSLPVPANLPPAAPPPAAPAQPAAGPNAIGCTPLSGTLPISAVNQARSLLALDPSSADERFRPSLVTIDTMRRLANDLRGCGSALGFNPTRDALVRDLETTATRFETALGGIRGPVVGLDNVLRFAS